MGENGLIKRAEKASQMHANSVASEGEAIDSLLQQLGTGSGQGGNEGPEENKDQSIIITSNVETREGKKYIDLNFGIAGLPATMEAYGQQYLEENFLKFIDHNLLPEYTNEQIEAIFIELGDDTEVVDGKLTDDMKSEVIAQVSDLFNQAFTNMNMSDIQITIPLEQSLRITLYCAYNNIYIMGETGLNFIQGLLQQAMYNMYYCAFCDILGIEAYYTAGEIEQQCVDIYKKYTDASFNGTFEQVIAKYNMTKDDLETMAEQGGVTYELMLKTLVLEMSGQLININVAVSNGDNFVTMPFETYSYEITQEGTYTFTAELQDGSGRRGEITVDTEKTDNPYDPDGWEVAWTYTDGVWSNIIQKGETAEGDIVAKFYKTENTITPAPHPSIGNPSEEGPAYTMVVEGKGELGDQVDDDDVYGYFATTPTGTFSAMIGGGTNIYEGTRYPLYVTEVYVCDGVTSLGDGAFTDFVSMEKIRLPETIESMGYGAFSNCVSLTDITIPNGVTSIGEDAFVSCTALTDIILPENLNSISKEMFSSCPNLTSITIPSSVKTIEEKAFYDCTSLTDITISNGVTSIGEDAFYGCTSITSITIPDGVTVIGLGAFRDCTNLKSITLPSSITDINTNTSFLDIHEDAVIYVAKGFSTTLKSALISAGYNVQQLQ